VRIGGWSFGSIQKKGKKTVATFIYCPKSGDRVFASLETNAIKVVKWPNGCRHVVGGVTLSYHTATPNEHWRYDAVLVAKELVEIIGGIAWDEQGTISMVVPLNKAVIADQWMRKVRWAAIGKNWIPEEDGLNEAKLLLGRCGFLVGGDYSIDFLGTMPPDPVVELIHQEDNTYQVVIDGRQAGTIVYKEFQKQQADKGDDSQVDSNFLVSSNCVVDC
jgi:hypothetical protein